MKEKTHITSKRALNAFLLSEKLQSFTTCYKSLSKLLQSQLDFGPTSVLGVSLKEQLSSYTSFLQADDQIIGCTFSWAAPGLFPSPQA